MLILNPIDPGLPIGRGVCGLRVGRSRRYNDLVLSGEDISSCHALFAWREARWLVRDLNSRNGTWLDETPIETWCAVEPGATLRFGASTVYRVESALPPPKPWPVLDEDLAATASRDHDLARPWVLRLEMLPGERGQLALVRGERRTSVKLGRYFNLVWALAAAAVEGEEAGWIEDEAARQAVWGAEHVELSNGVLDRAVHDVRTALDTLGLEAKQVLIREPGRMRLTLPAMCVELSS